MLEFFVGSGLAAAAGLNAWMPLLVLGLADRFLSVVQLPAAWAWLSSDVALWVVGALLVVEIVADKIPALDTVNDVIHSFIRPASGGIVFGAGATADTVRVSDPAAFFADSAWVPILTGVGIALAVHIAKASIRVLANSATGGIAAPVLSTIEDISSFTLAVLAIALPVLAVGAILAGVLAVVFGIRRLRRRRARIRSAPSP